MSAQFIDALMQLVNRVDNDPRKFDLQRIKSRTPYSKDRYVLNAFSWARVMELEAPALVFVGSCDLGAGVRGYTRIPNDPQPIFDILGTTNIRGFVE
ncbi:hypothetical protein GN958_ATG08199 [Phytophthora infestans]|uniref:Uncharacterized protein n=1 Tax=Phytophthora infestans TaxID=4787 RepID=A0A8S9UWU4_PHYIN|nr:hypothetical protein GN958_ATG08199 [Phytophthora infestans]